MLFTVFFTEGHFFSPFYRTYFQPVDADAAARQRGAARIVVAVPVAAPETIEEMRREVDEIAYVHAPSRFSAVGLWYEDFSETSDETVRELLGGSRS